MMWVGNGKESSGGKGGGEGERKKETKGRGARVGKGG